MTNIVTLPSRTAGIYLGTNKLRGADQELLAASEPLDPEGGLGLPVRCLVCCTDWQDTTSQPGWTMAAGTVTLQPIIAGTLAKGALIDGGFLRVLVSGSFVANSANPILLAKVSAWEDFYGASPSATIIGPTNGWGWSNSQTGIGKLTGYSGQYLLDVMLLSLGQNKSSDNILATGTFKLFDGEIGDDGGLVTPVTRSVYEIHKMYDFDFGPEYEITLDMGMRISSSGTDVITIDAASIWQYGGRYGIEDVE